MNCQHARRAILPLLFGLMAAYGAQGDEYIAGTAPDARPPEAPRLTTYAKDGQWYRRALTGVSQPYPLSLRFLEDQGAWHTPFTVPGMTGLYDIRDWRRSASAEGGQDAGRR